MESPPDDPLIGLSFLLLLQPASPLEIGIASLVVVLLLVGSALISGSEAAFFSLNRVAVDKLLVTATHKRRAQVVYELFYEPNYLLSTILIVNNLINVGIVIVSWFIIERLMRGAEEWLIFLINVVLVTFLLVLFGEVLPKVYTARNPRRFALRIGPVLLLLRRFFRPLSWILVSSTGVINRRLARLENDKASLEEVDRAIDLAVEGHATAQERKILKGVVQFGNISVSQVMTAHTDMTSVEYGKPFPELLKIVRESGYSRIPVWQDETNNIVGIFYTKDLLGYLDEEDPVFDWADKVKEAYFVPENKKIDDLLREFQERRIHIAVVVDEYGGTSGLVTLEDIMEEVVGEIEDEFDEQEIDFRKLDDKTYLFKGGAQLGDVCKVLGKRTDIFEQIRGDADTLAGLLLELAGHIPQPEEEHIYGGFQFTVLEASRLRIEKVKVTLLADEASDRRPHVA